MVTWILSQVTQFLCLQNWDTIPTQPGPHSIEILENTTLWNILETIGSPLKGEFEMQSKTFMQCDPE